jgi:excisionase family DNA binding protein
MQEQEFKTLRKTKDRREAATYLGVCVMTVDRAMNAGELGYYRIGRRILFDPERHLDVYLMKNERKAG